MTTLPLLLLASTLRSSNPGWTISVAYPRFSAAGPTSRRANATTASMERRDFRAFLSKARREVPGLKGQVTTPHYDLKVTPHRVADRPGLASGYVERYTYLAGAHGTTDYRAFDFGPRGPLRLRDLFRPGENAVGQASRALVAIMKGMKDVPSNVADGSWTRLTPEEADRFVVGKLGVLFLFDQYEVGYGAQGAPKVLVPYARLPGIDRQGVLAAVIR